MKNKLSLLFLPVLMALTSCAGLSKQVDNKVFLEDVTAQSNLFGNQDIVGGNLQIKNRAKGEAISTPKIGYQLRFDEDNDVLAIRFVAAIKELNVKAYWRRGVAGADGSELRSKSFANNGKEVTKYYTSLSDGNSTITAGEPGDYADYVGFVVYSIYNIPYTANKNAYVAAYVNLVGDEDGDSNIHNNSLALAVKIETKTDYESNNVFAFDPTVNGHFLEGTINGTLFDGGTNGLYRESDPTRKNDTDFAWYENIHLKTTDSFGSFYYDHDRIFQYFGDNPFFKESAGFFEKASQSGFVKPIIEGTYEMHISSGNANHVYTSAKSYDGSLSSYTMLYLIPGAWNEANAWYNAHFFDGANADLKMTDSDGDGVYEVAIPSGASKVTICRMDPNENGHSDLNWYINNHAVWNKTGDMTLNDRFNAAGPLGACSITAAGDYKEQWLGGASNIMR